MCLKKYVWIVCDELIVKEKENKNEGRKEGGIDGWLEGRPMTVLVLARRFSGFLSTTSTNHKKTPGPSIYF